MNESFKLASKALATLINLTYYYCHKDKLKIQFARHDFTLIN